MPLGFETKRERGDKKNRGKKMRLKRGISGPSGVSLIEQEGFSFQGEIKRESKRPYQTLTEVLGGQKIFWCTCTVRKQKEERKGGRKVDKGCLQSPIKVLVRHRLPLYSDRGRPLRGQVRRGRSSHSPKIPARSHHGIQKSPKERNDGL